MGAELAVSATARAVALHMLCLGLLSAYPSSHRPASVLRPQVSDVDTGVLFGVLLDDICGSRYCGPYRLCMSVPSGQVLWVMTMVCWSPDPPADCPGKGYR
jgi:hypothetical protein